MEHDRKESGEANAPATPDGAAPEPKDPDDIVEEGILRSLRAVAKRRQAEMPQEPQQDPGQLEE